MILQIALDIPHVGVLDYELDQKTEGLKLIGKWVIVPLKNKLELGIITGVSKKKNKNYALKKVNTIISQLPIMDDDWLEFIRFSSLYYHKSIGQTVFNSVPRIIRE